MMESYVSNVKRNGSDLLETLEFKTPSPLTSISESENENEVVEKINISTTERKSKDERQIYRLIPDYVTEESTASSENSSGESSPSTLKKRLHNLPAPSEALKLADRVATLNRRIRRERDIYLHRQGLSNRIEEKDEIEIVTTGSSTATSILENVAKGKSRDARTRRRERINLESSFQSDHRLLSPPETLILKKSRENCEEKLKNSQNCNQDLEELNEGICIKKELNSDISHVQDLPVDHDLTLMLDDFEDSDHARGLQQDFSGFSKRPFNKKALRSYVDRTSEDNKYQQNTSLKYRPEIIHDKVAGGNCLSPERNVTIPTSPSRSDCSNFVNHLRIPLKFGGYRPSQSGIFIHNLSSDSDSDIASEKTVRKVLSSHKMSTSNLHNVDGIDDREVQFRILTDDDKSQTDLDLISITSCSPSPAKITEIQQQGSANSREKNDQLIAANDNDSLKIPTLKIESQELSRSISAGSREDSSKEPLDVNALIRALSDVSLKQNCLADDNVFSVVEKNSPVYSYGSRASKSSGLKSAERTPATNRSKQSLTPLETRNSKFFHRRSTNLFRSNIIVQSPDELPDESSVLTSCKKYAEDIPEYKSPITRTIERNFMRSKHSSKMSAIGEPAFLSPGTIEKSEFSKDTSTKLLTSRTEGTLSQSSRSSMSARSFKSLSPTIKTCGKKKSNLRLVKVEKLEDLQTLSRQSLKSLKIVRKPEEGPFLSVNHDETLSHRSEIQSDTLSRRSLESSTSKNSENANRHSINKRFKESSTQCTEASSSRARSNKSIYRSKVLDGTETVIRRFPDNSTGSKVKVINRSNCSASLDEPKTLMRNYVHLDDLQERSVVCVPNADAKVHKRKPEDGGTLNRANDKDIRVNSCCCSEESAESNFKDDFIEGTEDSIESVKINGGIKAEEIGRSFSGNPDLTVSFDSNASSKRPSIKRKCYNEAASNCSSSSSNSRQSLDDLRNTLPCINTYCENQGLVSRTHSFLTDDGHSPSKSEGIYSETLPDHKILKRFTKNSRSPLINPNHLGALETPRSLGLDPNGLGTPRKMGKGLNDSNFNKRTTNISNTRMAQNADGTDLKSKNTNAQFSTHTSDPKLDEDTNSNEHSQNSNERSEDTNAISEIARFENCIRNAHHDSGELLNGEKFREYVGSSAKKESVQTIYTTSYSKNNYCSCKAFLPDIEMQSPRETCCTMKREEKELEDQTCFSPRTFVCSNCQTQCKREAYFCAPRSMKLSNENSCSRDVREDAESTMKAKSPLVKLEDDRSIIPLRSEKNKNDPFDDNVYVNPTEFIKSESATDILRRAFEFSSSPAKMSVSMSRLNLTTETPKNNMASVGRRSQDRFPFTISESTSKKSSKFKVATGTMMDHQAEWNATQEKSLFPDRITSGHWNGLRRTVLDKFDIYPTHVQQLANRPKDSVPPKMVSCVSYGCSQSEPRNLVPRMKGFVRKFSAKLKRSTSKSRKLKNEPTKVLYENPECYGDSIKGSSSNSYDSGRRSGQFETKLPSEGSKISSGKSLRSKKSFENVALTYKTHRKSYDLENVQEKLHDDLWIQEFDSENEFDENVTVTSSPLWKERTLKNSPVNSKDRYAVFLAKDELRAQSIESGRKSVVDKNNGCDIHPKKINNAEDQNNSGLTSRIPINSLINEQVEVTNNDNDLNDSGIETGCFCLKCCQSFAQLFDACKFHSSVSRSRLKVKK